MGKCVPLQPPMLGSGEIEGRFRPRSIPESKPLPWYYDQTKSTFVTVMVCAALVVLGRVLG